LENCIAMNGALINAKEIVLGVLRGARHGFESLEIEVSQIVITLLSHFLTRAWFCSSRSGYSNHVIVSGYPRSNIRQGRYIGTGSSSQGDVGYSVGAHWKRQF
jgi:hypothetical protein